MTRWSAAATSSRRLPGAATAPSSRTCATTGRRPSASTSASRATAARRGPTVVDGALPNPGTSVDVVTLRSGRWALVYNDLERGRHSLAISLSDDEGRTWPVDPPSRARPRRRDRRRDGAVPLPVDHPVEGRHDPRDLQHLPAAREQREGRPGSAAAQVDQARRVRSRRGWRRATPDSASRRTPNAERRNPRVKPSDLSGGFHDAERRTKSDAYTCEDEGRRPTAEGR